MSDTILFFLERLGRDGGIGDQDAYAAAVAALDIPVQESRLLAAKDADGLSALLGGRREMMIQVWAPAKDPKRKENPDEADVPDPQRPDRERPDPKQPDPQQPSTDASPMDAPVED